MGCILAALTCLSARADDPKPLPDRLAAALQSLPDRANVAVCVLRASDAALVFEKSADEPLRPASTMKLLVTAAALDRFGPDFEFRTTVYAANDELWIIGGGDPGLGDPRLAQKTGQSPESVLDQWADAVSTAGITTISKIVIDDTIFDTECRHPDWPASQSQRWYAAPVGGLNFNDNCLDARVVVAGRSASLKLTPDLPGSFIENKLVVAGRQRASVTRDADSDIFRFTGTVSRAAEFGPVSFNRPTVVFGYALRQSLLKRGLTVADDIVRRAVTPDAQRSARIIAGHSTPLTDVIWRANNFSQNLFAECLVKTLAAYEPDAAPPGDIDDRADVPTARADVPVTHTDVSTARADIHPARADVHRDRSGIPGSWEAGTQRVRQILNRLGVNLDRATLRDGSGLSHQNRVTARQLATALSVMHKHRFAAAFESSLARPGQDGTLRRRFLDEPLRSRLRAKTGTLLGVSALAGYVQSDAGEILAFAILCDAPESAARAVEDAIVRQLAGAASQPGSFSPHRTQPAPKSSRRSRRDR